MKSFSVSIPEPIQAVLKHLNAAGFEAYLVGGTVRDAVMGKAPHDYDITTDARPQAVKELFEQKGYKVIETGLKHGTVTVLCGKEPVEITTYRIDGEYADARHPKEVLFTDKLSEDLRRRDFTINALAYAPQTGLVDLFGGLADIDGKVLRCIGDPRERFSEDALRILRAIRFSARLDFAIEPETAKALLALRHLLAHISAERITSELLGFFEMGRPTRIYDILNAFRPVVSQILPETYTLSAEVYQKRCYLCARLPNGVTDSRFENLRFSFFFAATGVGKEALDRLKLPKAFIKRILALSEILPLATETKNRIQLRKLLARFGESACRDAAVILQTNRENPHFLPLLQDCLQSGDCVSLASLAVNGTDLAALGYSGTVVGKILKETLLAVMEEKVENTPTRLLAYIQEKYR